MIWKDEMLYNPPLEIIELLESIYDESGRMIGKKLSDDATPEKKLCMSNIKRNAMSN